MNLFLNVYGIPFAAIAVLAYFIGSVPFGYLVVRFFVGEDIRSSGSGNIGTANVLRTGRKKLALLTLALDFSKGFIAVWLSQQLAPIPEAGYFALLMVVVGHVAPVWLKFKGGKGVASYAGALLASDLSVFLLFALIWLVCLAFWRYASLAALAATLAAPVSVYLATCVVRGAVLCAIAALLVGLRHWQNIRRLLSGTEPKVRLR